MTVNFGMLSQSAALSPLNNQDDQPSEGDGLFANMFAAMSEGVNVGGMLVKAGDRQEVATLTANAVGEDVKSESPIFQVNSMTYNGDDASTSSLNAILTPKFNNELIANALAGDEQLTVALPRDVEVSKFNSIAESMFSLSPSFPVKESFTKADVTAIMAQFTDVPPRKDASEIIADPISASSELESQSAILGIEAIDAENNEYATDFADTSASDVLLENAEWVPGLAEGDLTVKLHSDLPNLAEMPDKAKSSEPNGAAANRVNTTEMLIQNNDLAEHATGLPESDDLVSQEGIISAPILSKGPLDINVKNSASNMNSMVEGGAKDNTLAHENIIASLDADEMNDVPISMASAAMTMSTKNNDNAPETSLKSTGDKKTAQSALFNVNSAAISVDLAKSDNKPFLAESGFATSESIAKTDTNPESNSIDAVLENGLEKSDLNKVDLPVNSKTNSDAVKLSTATNLTELVEQPSESEIELSEFELMQEIEKAIHVKKEALDEQLHTRIRLLVANNINKAEIRLDPPELGALELKIEQQADEVKVTIITQTQHGKEILEQQIDRLRELLQQQGLNLSQGDVSQQSGGQGQQGEAEMMDDFENEDVPEKAISIHLVDHYI